MAGPKFWEYAPPEVRDTLRQQEAMPIAPPQQFQPPPQPQQGIQVFPRQDVQGPPVPPPIEGPTLAGLFGQGAAPNPLLNTLYNAWQGVNFPLEVLSQNIKFPTAARIGQTPDIVPGGDVPGLGVIPDILNPILKFPGAAAQTYQTLLQGPEARQEQRVMGQQERMSQTLIQRLASEFLLGPETLLTPLKALGVGGRALGRVEAALSPISKEGLVEPARAAARGVAGRLKIGGVPIREIKTEEQYKLEGITQIGQQWRRALGTRDAEAPQVLKEALAAHKAGEETPLKWTLDRVLASDEDALAKLSAGSKTGPDVERGLTGAFQKIPIQHLKFYDYMEAGWLGADRSMDEIKVASELYNPQGVKEWFDQTPMGGWIAKDKMLEGAPILGRLLYSPKSVGQKFQKGLARSWLSFPGYAVGNIMETLFLPLFNGYGMDFAGLRNWGTVERLMDTPAELGIAAENLTTAGRVIRRDAPKGQQGSFERFFWDYVMGRKAIEWSSKGVVSGRRAAYLQMVKSNVGDKGRQVAPGLYQMLDQLGDRPGLPADQLQYLLAAAKASGDEAVGPIVEALAEGRLTRQTIEQVVSNHPGDLPPGLPSMLYDMEGLTPSQIADSLPAAEQAVQDFYKHFPEQVEVLAKTADSFLDQMRALPETPTPEQLEGMAQKVEDVTALVHESFLNLPRFAGDEAARLAQEGRPYVALVRNLWKQIEEVRTRLVKESYPRVITILDKAKAVPGMEDRFQGLSVALKDLKPVLEKDRAFMASWFDEGSLRKISGPQWAEYHAGRSEIWKDHLDSFRPIFQLGKDLDDIVVRGTAAAEGLPQLLDYREQFLGPRMESVRNLFTELGEQLPKRLQEGQLEGLRDFGKAVADAPMSPAERQALKAVFKQASTDATLKFRQDFINMDDRNIFDFFATKVFPFAVYDMRRLGYVARMFAQRPETMWNTFRPPTDFDPGGWYWRGDQDLPSNGNWTAMKIGDMDVDINPARLLGLFVPLRATRTGGLLPEARTPGVTSAPARVLERGAETLASVGFFPGPIAEGVRTATEAVLDLVLDPESTPQDAFERMKRFAFEDLSFPVLDSAVSAASAAAGQQVVPKRFERHSLDRWLATMKKTRIDPTPAQKARGIEKAAPEDLRKATRLAALENIIDQFSGFTRLRPGPLQESRRGYAGRLAEAAGLSLEEVRQARVRKEPIETDLTRVERREIAEEFPERTLAAGTSAFLPGSAQRDKLAVGEYHDAVQTYYSPRNEQYSRFQAVTEAFERGDATDEQWRAARRSFFDGLRGAKSAVASSYGMSATEFEDTYLSKEAQETFRQRYGLPEVPAPHPLDAAAEEFYAMEMDDFLDPKTQRIDFHAYRQRLKDFEAKVGSQTMSYIRGPYIRDRWGPGPMADTLNEYNQAIEALGEYSDIPRYIGRTWNEGEEIARAKQRRSDYLADGKAKGMAPGQALARFRKAEPKLYRLSLMKTRPSPRRDNFVRGHPLFTKYFRSGVVSD